MSDGPVVAIDLGVTTVAAALDTDDGAVDALDPADLPTDLAAVFAPADGTALVVGAAARRLAPTDPSRYEPTPRLRVDEPDLLLGTRVVGVSEAWGAVLAGVLDRAGPLLRGGRPRHLVLTHPAGWDAGRREVLRRAGSGLAEDLTLVPEAVAAAAHAGWMRPRGTGGPASRARPLAVLDLGARGASAAVLAPVAGRCGGARLLARREGARFGGDDADELLLGHLLTALHDDPDDPGDADRVLEVVAGTTLADRRHRQVLLDDVRAAKEQLSDAEQAAVPLPGRVTAAWLSRGELTEVLRPALRGVVDLLADTLADAGTGPEHLDGVWLSGGGARIPLLAALVHRELGVPATVAPEPRSVVAHGALVVAREDAGSRHGPAREPAAALAYAGLRPGPLLDPPTAPLPPAVGERTEDLGEPADDPAWLTPTSPERTDVQVPVRRVEDPTAPADRLDDTDLVEPVDDVGEPRHLPARRPLPARAGRPGGSVSAP